jgi:hypothetical protein
MGDLCGTKEHNICDLCGRKKHNMSDLCGREKKNIIWVNCVQGKRRT